MATNGKKNSSLSNFPGQAESSSKYKLDVKLSINEKEVFTVMRHWRDMNRNIGEAGVIMFQR